MAKEELSETPSSQSPNLDALPDEVKNYIIRQEKRIAQLEYLLSVEEKTYEQTETNTELLNLYDQLGYGVLTENNVGMVSHANRNFWKIFRLSIPPDEIIGSRIDNLLAELKNLFIESIGFEKGIREIIQNKELVVSRAFELKTRKIIEVEYLPNYRANTYLGQLLVFKDVTQIRQSSAQIERLKLQLEGILNASTSGIIAFSSVRNEEGELVDFEVIASNKAAENKLGRKIVLQMLGKKLIDSLSESSMSDLFDKYRNVVESGITLDHEYSINTKNEVIWVHSVAVKLEDGLVVTFSDITSTKKANQIVQQQSNILDGITGNIPVVIYKLSSTGEYKEVFGAGLAALNREDNSMVGLNMIERQPHLKQYFYRALNGESVSYVSNGQIEEKEWFFENYLFKDPYSEGLIGFALDITEKSIAERELIEAKKIAESSMKAKEIFLANMSHEIRTPMSGILGMAQLLDKTTLNLDQKNYLNIIKKSAENLLVILNDILDLAKIESGKLQIEHIPFDLRELAETAIGSFIYKADEKAILLKKNLDAIKNPFVIGDPFRLNQILINLLSNAIKFTEKGTVTLDLTLCHEDAKHITYQFCVEDTGIGIDPDVVPKLFDQFVQAETNTGRKYGGTGLGLSISKNLLEMQGGRIWVESQKGIGSKFYFQLQFEKTITKSLEKNTSEVEYNLTHLKGVKVLLAEDNEINQFFAKTILESQGCEVTIVANGVDCVDLYKNKEFDIILMDIQMPQMNGLEATKMIRNDSKTHSQTIPILALSANALPGDKENYLQIGMNDSLAKPYGEQELLEKMLLLLEKKATVSNSKETDNSTTKQPKPYQLLQLEEVSKGNKAFVDKMIHLFLETSSETVTEIRNAFQEKQWKHMSEAAHKFKSSIDTMSIVSIKQTIRDIETFNPTTGDMELLKGWISKVEETTLKVQEEMKRDLNQN